MNLYQFNIQNKDLSPIKLMETKVLMGKGYLSIKIGTAAQLTNKRLNHYLKVKTLNLYLYLFSIKTKDSIPSKLMETEARWGKGPGVIASEKGHGSH